MAKSKTKTAPANPISQELTTLLGKQITEADQYVLAGAISATATGFLARSIKLQLPHGEFTPWLIGHVLHAVAAGKTDGQLRKIRRWMDLSEAVQAILNDVVKTDTCPICTVGDDELEDAFRALTTQDDPEWKPWREAAVELLDGHSQKELVMQLRNPSDAAPHQVHTPSTLTAEQQAALAAAEAEEVWSQLEMQFLAHGQTAASWGLLPVARRTQLLTTTFLPVIEEIAANTRLDATARQDLIRRVDGIKARLLAQVPKPALVA